MNGTRPETHTRVDFMSSLPVLPSHGTQVTSTLGLYSTSNTEFSIKSCCSLKEAQIQTVRAKKAHEPENSIISLDDTPRRRAKL